MIILQYIRRGRRGYDTHKSPWPVAGIFLIDAFVPHPYSDYFTSSPAVSVALLGNEVLYGIIKGIEVSPLTIS